MHIRKLKNCLKIIISIEVPRSFLRYILQVDIHPKSNNIIKPFSTPNKDLENVSHKVAWQKMVSRSHVTVQKVYFLINLLN